METEQFILNIGINEGYGHNNEKKDFYAQLCKTWQKLTDVGAMIYPVKTVYSTQKGCPSGGEDTFIITGVRNPYYQADKLKWKEIVINVSNELRKELKQVTAYLIFQEVEFHYLRN